MECYCVLREIAIKRDKNNSQKPAIISRGCGFQVFSRVVNSVVIGLLHNEPFRIKSKCSRFSGFHNDKKNIDYINVKSPVQIS